MRSWTRPLVSTLLVGTLLMVGASCSNEDSLTGPSSPEPSAAAAPAPKLESLLDPTLQLLDPTLQKVLSTLNLLTCARQPYAQATAVIGSAGGQLVVGAHRLVIPAGALSAPVRITAEQVSGTVNSVRFSPEGLKFAKPATLTMSYGNCLLVPLRKQVVYTNEQLKILDVVTSFDLRLTRTVTGLINHFSRYAVAY
jgi:hypothetical protein